MSQGLVYFNSDKTPLDTPFHFYGARPNSTEFFNTLLEIETEDFLHCGCTIGDKHHADAYICGESSSLRPKDFNKWKDLLFEKNLWIAQYPEIFGFMLMNPKVFIHFQ